MSVNHYLRGISQHLVKAPRLMMLNSHHAAPGITTFRHSSLLPSSLSSSSTSICQCGLHHSTASRRVHTHATDGEVVSSMMRQVPSTSASVATDTHLTQSMRDYATSSTISSTSDFGDMKIVD